MSKLSYLLLCCLFVSCIEAPSPSDPNLSSQPASPTIISFAASAIDRHAYSRLIAAFEAQNPDIRVVFEDSEDINAANTSNSTNSTLARSVDTALIYTSLDGGDQHWFLDLKPLIDSDTNFNISDYFPRAFEAATHDGQLNVLPLSATAPILAYNKTLLATVSATPPPITSGWKELLDVAALLATRDSQAVQRFGIMTGDIGFAALLHDLEQAGIDPVSTETGVVNLLNPALVEQFQRAKTRARDGIVWHPRVRKDPEEMVVVTEEIPRLVREQRLGIWDTFYYQPDNQTPFPVGYLPQPQPKIPAYIPGQWGYAISRGSQHIEAAWRWIAFLSTQDTPNLRNLSLDSVPARRSLVEQLGGWLSKSPEYVSAQQFALEQPLRLPRNFNHTNWLALQSAWNRVMDPENTVESALKLELEQLDQLLITNTPQPTPASFTVPQAELPDPFTSTIVFGSMLDTALLNKSLTTFTRTYPNIHVHVVSVDIGSSQNIVEDVNRVSEMTDCFMWLDAPPRAIISSTLDLRPLAEGDSDFALADYPLALLQRYRQEDRLQGVPFSVQLRALAYNPALFSQRGIPAPQGGMSLDAFLSTAQQLHEPASEHYGYALGFSDYRNLQWFVDRFVATLVRNSTEGIVPNYTDPKTVRALEYYLTLLQTASPYSRVPSYPGNSQPERGYIIEGKVALWLTYGYDAIGSNAMAGVEAKIVPPPVGDATTSNSDMHTLGMHISAHTPAVQACWDLIRTLSFDPALVYPGSFPARRSLIEIPGFAWQNPEALSLYRNYADALNSTTSSYDIFQDPEFDTWWLFHAIDQALQGHNLEQELQRANDLTLLYLQCVRGGGTRQDCQQQIDPMYRKQPEN